MRQEKNTKISSQKKHQKRVDPTKIHWTPYESGRKRDPWLIASKIRGLLDQDETLKEVLNKHIYAF